jgi:hypothetical protein
VKTQSIQQTFRKHYVIHTKNYEFEHNIVRQITVATEPLLVERTTPKNLLYPEGNGFDGETIVYNA